MRSSCHDLRHRHRETGAAPSISSRIKLKPCLFINQKRQLGSLGRAAINQQLQRRRCKNPHQNENANCQLNADDLKNHFLCYERRCFRCDGTGQTAGSVTGSSESGGGIQLLKKRT
jgi:hypothetical protein